MRPLRRALVRGVLMAAGAVLAALLVSLLPDAVRASARAFLLAAASAILLLVAGALFLLPARRLLARAFALPLRLEGPAMGLPPEDEMRTTLRPLVTAGVCMGVALLAEAFRAGL